MKTVTVRDFTKSSCKISAWLDQGEEVTITKRGRSFARILDFLESPSATLYGPRDLAHLEKPSSLLLRKPRSETTVHLEVGPIESKNL
jgi:antitoxin (DNA-binding transcriptional repressor) of toxin-antitoxin stability system